MTSGSRWRCAPVLLVVWPEAFQCWSLQAVGKVRSADLCLPRRVSKIPKYVLPRFLWRYCFGLGVLKTLYVASESGVCFPQSCGALVLKPCWPPGLNALGAGGGGCVSSQCQTLRLSWWDVFRKDHPYVGLIFFGAGALFSLDVCRLFPRVCWQ